MQCLAAQCQTMLYWAMPNYALQHRILSLKSLPWNAVLSPAQRRPAQHGAGKISPLKHRQIARDA